jgi:large subunit ribosomal protein L15
MQQHELRQPKGATHKRKRVGRGNASGHGTYSTRGMKGQKARSGGGVRPGFEGGQLPLVRRMAYKRGFRNPFRVDYEEVNVGSLSHFAAGAEVNVEALKGARLVRTGRPVKVLGHGEISVALTVEAASFSKSARGKIEAAGGSVRWLNGEPTAEEPAVRTGAAARKRAAKAAAAAAPKATAKADKTEKADKSEQPPKAEKKKAPAKEEATDGAGS